MRCLLIAAVAYLLTVGSALAQSDTAVPSISRQGQTSLLASTATGIISRKDYVASMLAFGIERRKGSMGLRLEGGYVRINLFTPIYPRGNGKGIPFLLGANSFTHSGLVAGGLSQYLFGKLLLYAGAGVRLDLIGEFPEDTAGQPQAPLADLPSFRLAVGYQFSGLAGYDIPLSTEGDLYLTPLAGMQYSKVSGYRGFVNLMLGLQIKKALAPNRSI